MTPVIATILLITIPLYIAFRYKTAQSNLVLNYCLYPTIFSYFYLLIPIFIDSSSFKDQSLQLRHNFTPTIDALSIWWTACFFIAYLKSHDRPQTFNCKLKIKPISLIISRCTQIFTAAVITYIIIKHGAALYIISDSRSLAYEYYERNIIGAFNIPILFSASILGCTLMYLHKRNIAQLTPLLPFVILDTLHGGRGYTFSTIIIVYINLTTINPRSFRRNSIILISTTSFLFVSAFIRRHVFESSTADPFASFFGEFVFTRMTAEIALDYFNGYGDLFTYTLTSISRLLPQSLVSPIFDTDSLTNYAVIINQSSGLSFGLAGSPLAEAIFYGGIFFAITSPIIVAATLLLLNEKFKRESAFGFMFFLMIISSMPLFFRSGFYTPFFSVVYIFISYLLPITIPSAKIKIFTPKLKI